MSMNQNNKVIILANPGVFSDHYNITMDFYKGPLRSFEQNDDRLRPDKALGDPRKKNFEYYNDLLEINKKSKHMKKFFDPKKMRSTSLNVKKMNLMPGFRQTLEDIDEDKL